MAAVKKATNSKYTEETVAKIVEALRFGASFEGAAAWADVSRATIDQWRRKYPEFRERVERAVEAAEVYYLGKIHAAAQKQWQAAAWWLERVRHDRYGKQPQLVQITDENKRPIKVIIGGKNGEDTKSKSA